MHPEEWKRIESGLVQEVRVARAVFNELVDRANWAPKLDKLMMDALRGGITGSFTGVVLREVHDAVNKAHFAFGEAMRGAKASPQYFSREEVLDFLNRQAEKWRQEIQRAPGDPYPVAMQAALVSAIMDFEKEPPNG